MHMPVITLPDGSSRQFDNAISVYDVAADIGAGLAKATLAGVVDGREVDASFSIDSDAELRIITSRDDQALEILRHSTAHLLAQAVQQLFPGTQVTIGPTVEDGFYYDFASDHNFSLEDLEKIESKMQALVADDLPVSRLVYSREQAVEMFRDMGEHYKVEIIEELPEGEEISVYQQGDWICLVSLRQRNAITERLVENWACSILPTMHPALYFGIQRVGRCFASYWSTCAADRTRQTMLR
jgi:threonyl-tRNA synthetase